MDRARTFVGILRPFAVCRAGARDEEGEESGALRALGHVSPRVVAKKKSVLAMSRLITRTKRFFRVKKRERTVDGDRRAAR